MPLTAVTWLTSEIIDETRLNTMVDNSTYTKNLFTSGCPWSASSWTDLGWVDITPFATDQIIDSTRMNQMYTNQNVLLSKVSSGETIWNAPDEMRYDENILPNYLGVFYLMVNGEQIGSTYSFAPDIGMRYSTAPTTVICNGTNLDISRIPDGSIVDVNYNYGFDSSEIVKFVKISTINYISYTVTLRNYDSYPYFGLKDLKVIVHRNPVASI